MPIRLHLMGIISRTNKRGKEMFGWLCCIDDGKEKAPEDEKKRKNAQNQNDQNVGKKSRRLPRLFICHDNEPADDENLPDQKPQGGDGEKRTKKKRKRKLMPEMFSRSKKLAPKDESKASTITAREGEKRSKRRSLPNVLSRDESPKDEIREVSENAPSRDHDQKRKKKRRKLVKVFHRNKKKRSGNNLATADRQEKVEKVKEKKLMKIDEKDEDVITPKNSQEEDEKKNSKKKTKRRRRILFRKKWTSKDDDTTSNESEEKKNKKKVLKAPKDQGMPPNNSPEDEKRSSKTSTDENERLSNAQADNKEMKKKGWRRRKMVKIFWRSKKLQKDKTKTSLERKKKIRFWRKKKKKQQQQQKNNTNQLSPLVSTKKNKTHHLASLISTMSSISCDNAQQTSAVEEILSIGNTGIPTRAFALREIAAATKNFHSDNLLGEGGFGKVYKGQLRDTNETVAVKQLDKNGYQGNREFLVEVLMLSRLRHPNLVKLVGYCAEGDERILVYEYMSLGSLEDHLLEISPKSKALNWQTRMKIAAGAARGIEHLHDDTNPPVIYRDLKASNILLDEDFNPKLSDFGLAKVGPTGDKIHVSTRVMGTYGYCAPEYALTGQLTKMSDVYSFGVVLLEIITGRKAVDTSKPKKERILVHWAEPMFKDKRKFEMADPLLDGKYPVKGLCQALAVAEMCLQQEAAIRPLFRDIVTALNYLANPNYEVLTGSRDSIPRALMHAGSSQTAEGTAGASEDMVLSESTTYPESFSRSDQDSDDGIVINLPCPS